MMSIQSVCLIMSHCGAHLCTGDWKCQCHCQRCIAENVCEHGDHPAPSGKRFCSPECARCELADKLETDAECAGICQGAEP